jgi:site-specific recombinase XerD
MKKTTDKLINNAEQYLQDGKYAPSTILNYRREWKRFASHCEKAGAFQPSLEVAEEYLYGVRRVEGKSDSSFGYTNRAIRMLFDIESGIKPAVLYCIRRTACLPKRFLNQYESYIETQNAMGLASPTVISKSCMARHFLIWLEDTGVLSVDAINAGHIYGYIACYPYKAPQSVASLLFFLRDFIRYLCDSHGADQSMKRLLPTIPANKECVLPSAYSTHEVSRIIDSIRNDGECPLRNRAIVLMAAMHGLRIGDIKKLRLDDIDWPLRRLNIVQGKTGRHLTIPLHEECVLAIIDYLRSERPASGVPQIFLSCRAPFRPMGNRNSCHYIFTDIFERAGVDTKGKHHGAHSMRHSLASNMLGAKTPYPVITGILGHESSNTTKRYLSIDIESLRPLALEVPYGCR